jgi:hypothetical protein
MLLKPGLIFPGINRDAGSIRYFGHTTDLGFLGRIGKCKIFYSQLLQPGRTGIHGYGVIVVDHCILIEVKIHTVVKYVGHQVDMGIAVVH